MTSFVSIEMDEGATPILVGALIAALIVLLPVVAYSLYADLPILDVPRRFVSRLKSWTLPKRLKRFRIPHSLNIDVII